MGVIFLCPNTSDIFHNKHKSKSGIFYSEAASETKYLINGKLEREYNLRKHFLLKEGKNYLFIHGCTSTQYFICIDYFFFYYLCLNPQGKSVSFD